MNDIQFLKIMELKQELNKFLEEHPELRPLQAKIDAMLSGAGNQNNRNVLLSQMLKEQAIKLADSLEDLNKSLQQLVDLSKK